MTDGDFHDEDDAPQQVNPFQLTRTAWILRTCSRLLGTIRGWLLWPLLFLVSLLANLADRLGRGMGWIGGHVREACRWSCWRTLHLLRADRVQQQLRGWQQETAHAVGNLSDSVAARTTRGIWWRRLADLLRRGLHAMHLASLWLQAHLARWAAQSAFVRALLWPLGLLLRVTLLVADFCWGWCCTRSYRLLWLSTPALLLVLPLAYCLVRLPFHSRQAKAQEYRRAAVDALRAEDFAGAQLLYRKLHQLGDQNERVVFQSALLAAEQGDLQTAYQRVRSITASDNSLPEAHLWVAQAIANQLVEQQNPDRERLLRSHLNQVLDYYPGQPDAIVLLADLHQSAGRQEDALKLLRRLRADRLMPSQAVELARRYADMGQMTKATELAGNVVRQFEQRAQNAKLTSHDRLLWAAASELAADRAAAVQILLDAIDLDPDGPLLPVLQDRLIATATRHFDEQTDTWNGTQKLELLRRLLKIDPESEPVVQRLADLAADPQVADQTLQQIEDQRQRIPLPAAANAAVADACVQRSDWPRARTYYALAVENDARQHAALNNLAWLLAFSDPVDLPRALTLADQAVALMPENAHYRDTRGQILIKLQRWSDAVRDLELALNGMPESKPIHRSLAEAYEQLGDATLAAAHRAQQ